jgi:hypothetical protein
VLLSRTGIRIGIGIGIALACTALTACDVSPEPAEPSSPSQPDAGPMLDLEESVDASGLSYDCVIGSDAQRDPNEGPMFVALEPGGPIPIGGVGQAGLTAKLALRCTPASVHVQVLADAEVEMVLTNAFTLVVAPREPEPKAAELECNDTVCDAAVAIEISHLAKLPELEGLKVRADLRVLSTDGRLLGRDRTHGVLSP